MANNKKTVYQNLTKFLNFDGNGIDQNELQPNPQQKIILKAETPGELKVKG